MNIAPGVEAPSVLQIVELVRQSSTRWIDVTIYDVNGDPIDIVEEKFASGQPKGALDLEIVNLSSNVLFSEVYWPNNAPTTRRIKRLSTGRYSVALEDTETTSTGTYLANWHARINETSEDMYRTQVIEVVSPRVLSLLPPFRLMFDKHLKVSALEQMCTLGYTDGMLVMYLKQGLHMINAYEPYPCWATLEQFPIDYYSDILIKAALYEGIISQGLLAIDTDIPSYNDQGHAFVLSHFPPLMQMLSVIKQELDLRVPNFKRKHLQGGTMSVELRIDAAWAALTSSAPYGAIFRNYLVAGR